MKKSYNEKDYIKFVELRDKAHLLKQPSIDRKNSNSDYIYKNCRFIELSKNSSRVDHTNEEKAINQYDLEGNFIKTWKSTMSIERALGFDHGYISKVCLGKCKCAYKFIWKHKIKEKSC